MNADKHQDFVGPLVVAKRAITLPISLEYAAKGAGTQSLRHGVTPEIL